MIQGQNQKVVQVIAPAAAVNNAVFANTEIDTAGYDYCQIHFQLGATDVAMAALKVQEAAVSNTSHADVTGLVTGTSDNIAGSTSALPTNTQDNKVFTFDVDLVNRKKYLRLVAQAGEDSTTYGSAMAVLSRGRQAPTNAAERGAAAVLRV